MRTDDIFSIEVKSVLDIVKMTVTSDIKIKSLLRFSINEKEFLGSLIIQQTLPVLVFSDISKQKFQKSAYIRYNIKENSLEFTSGVDIRELNSGNIFFLPLIEVKNPSFLVDVIQ